MISLKMIRILAIIIWLPTIASLLAFNLGVLGAEYAIAISVVVIILGTIILTVTIRRIKSLTVHPFSVVIPKSKFIDKYVEANNEILPESIASVHPHRDGIVRIIMELVPDKENGPLKFYIIRKRDRDSHEQEIDIIRSSTVERHIFNISVDPREYINFKFNRGTIVQSFSVDELYIP